VKRILFTLLLGGIFAGDAHAAIVQTVDFIAVGQRTNFMGFEPLPATTNYGPSSYTEDGIVIQQINGQVNDIWTTLSWGQEGARSWYPNGGDNGYTRITRSGGTDFVDVGFLRTAFGNGSNIFYILKQDGAVVQSGSVSQTIASAQYLGFSGGGFDEILLRGASSSDTFFNGTENSMAIDSIELAGVTATPEPATLTMFGVGALGLVGAALRRRKLAA